MQGPPQYGSNCSARGLLIDLRQIRKIHEQPVSLQQIPIWYGFDPSGELWVHASNQDSQRWIDARASGCRAVAEYAAILKQQS
jgi:hypothetical protein